MTLQLDHGFPGPHRIVRETSLLAPPPQCARPSPAPLNLSRREAEVLALLAYRLTNAEIAGHLNISVRTAESHVERVLAKLQAANRREAASIAARWVSYAFVTGEDPKPAVPGIAYMLQGGSDASNTDPLAMEPAEGEDWVTSGPHVMLLLPGELDQSVFSTDHDSGQPYIMWAGTPYEHIMLPVAEGEHHE